MELRFRSEGLPGLQFGIGLRVRLTCVGFTSAWPGARSRQRHPFNGVRFRTHCLGLLMSLQATGITYKRKKLKVIPEGRSSQRPNAQQLRT